MIAGEPFTLTVEPDAVRWSPRYGAREYDVVWGDLVILRESGGEFIQAVATCLADNPPFLTLTHSEKPDSGKGLWYLVRGVSTAQNLTYDSRGPAQVAPRDVGIDEAPDSCP